MWRMDYRYNSYTPGYTQDRHQSKQAMDIGLQRFSSTGSTEHLGNERFSSNVALREWWILGCCTHRTDGLKSTVHLKRMDLSLLYT